MRHQPFRLPAETAGPFLGAAINRNKPIRFRLDGRIIEGFAGDTVLSAALASGIDTIGIVDGSPLGLGRAVAPAVRTAGSATPLPMERTPATEGADYVTGARRSMLQRLVGGNSLHLNGQPAPSVAAAAAAQLPRQAMQADLVVVGAGVAGLTAALAAARAGLMVTILEARPQPGGHAVLFGRQEGEDQPEAAIAALLDAVAASDAITLITGAEVASVRSGLVQAHAVGLVEGKPSARWLEVATSRVILATGSMERLPMFAGNRLPRVRGTLEAFELGWRYAMWPGRDAVVATASSVAYRLAMLAADAGIRISRVLDTRPGPESRFIAFSRAYGITQAPGTRAAAASRTRGQLRVATESALGGKGPAMNLITDSLVVCGGWQPDLTLWNGAGGFSRWQPERHRLEASGSLDGIVLAGSAAGWLSRTACADSGADAVDLLLGRARRRVEELSIDPIYDTPDDPPPVATERKTQVYLDAGRHLFAAPSGPSARPWPWQRRTLADTIADTPQPLDLGIVAASVQLGLIPPESAGAVAQERTGVALVTADPAEAPPPRPPALLPDYLVGRFGDRGQLWLVAPAEERTLEPGGLIQPDADRSDPLAAIGVVVRPIRHGALALLEGAAIRAGSTVMLRDGTRTVTLKVLAPYAEGMDLTAALGGSPGTA